MATYNGPNPNFENSNIWESLTCDGAIKCVPLEMDWTLQDSFEVDLLRAQQQDFLPGLGTLWFNNARTTNAAGAATAQDVLVNVAGTNQALTLKADREGYVPVLAPTPARLTFTGQSNAARTQVILISALLPGAITNAG